MQNNEAYVGSSCPRVIVRYLLEHGAQSEDIKAIIEEDLDELDSAEFRLPITRLLALWDYALEYSNEPALGLKLGCRYEEEEVGLVGHIFFSNATIEDALKQYQRYFSITNENMKVELKPGNDKVRLRYLCLTPDYYCQADIERTLAAGITRTREHLKQALPLDYVSFEHAPPDYANDYQEVFKCPVKFSCKHTEIVFSQKYMDFRLPHKSSFLQKVLSTHLDTLLSKISGKDSFKDRVSKLVLKRLSSDSIDAEQIAKKLNMSRNTMYRKLSNEGVSFHELVDALRKDKAIRYLKEGNYSLSQIAFLLGFSELSAFSRAFKRWTGLAPGKYLSNPDKAP